MNVKRILPRQDGINPPIVEFEQFVNALPEGTFVHSWQCDPYGGIVVLTQELEVTALDSSLIERGPQDVRIVGIDPTIVTDIEKIESLMEGDRR